MWSFSRNKSLKQTHAFGMLIRETYTFRCSITGPKSVIRQLKNSRHTFGGLVFAQQNRHLGEDTNMRPLKTQAGHQKSDDFLKVTTTFVQLDNCRQFLGVDNDVQTTDLRLMERSYSSSKMACLIFLTSVKSDFSMQAA